MADQNPSSQPLSPYQQSQDADNALPPAKRQRLSPSPASPSAQSPQPLLQPQPQQSALQSPPNTGNISLPQGIFNHSRPSTNGPANGYNTFRAVQPPVSTPPGTMGPPQRPADRPQDRPADKSIPREDKPLDINEINDLVASSGINIRDEEDYLYASYRNDRHNQSFRTDTSSLLTSPESSFDMLSKSQFNNLGSSHGSFNQKDPPSSQQDELFEKHRKAARALNESRQHHLDNPFLWGASLRKHLEKAANENNIRMPIDGLWDRVADRPETVSIAAAKTSDGSALQEAKAPSLLTRGAPMEAILSLLSLATNERIRGLLEDSYGLARGRVYGSDGVVPPQLSDLADAQGTSPTNVAPQSITNTTWDEPRLTSADGDAKREKNGLPSPPASNSNSAAELNSAVPSVEVKKPNALAVAMMAMSKRDRDEEERRLKIRAARRAKKATLAAQAATSSAVTPESGTPAPADSKAATQPGERAPETTLSKKEKAKAAHKDISEEVATRNANLTASMQVGGKKYSWLQSKPSAAATPPSGLRASTKDDQSGSSASKTQAVSSMDNAPPGSAERRMQNAGKQDRKFGDFREDGVGGKGIQLRDWVTVLEADGKERKTLAYALAGLGDEKKKPSDSDQRSGNTA